MFSATPFIVAINASYSISLPTYIVEGYAIQCKMLNLHTYPVQHLLYPAKNRFCLYRNDALYLQILLPVLH